MAHEVLGSSIPNSVNQLGKKGTEESGKKPASTINDIVSAQQDANKLIKDLTKSVEKFGDSSKDYTEQYQKIDENVLGSHTWLSRIVDSVNNLKDDTDGLSNFIDKKVESDKNDFKTFDSMKKLLDSIKDSSSNMDKMSENIDAINASITSIGDSSKNLDSINSSISSINETVSKLEVLLQKDNSKTNIDSSSSNTVTESPNAVFEERATEKVEESAIEENLASSSIENPVVQSPNAVLEEPAGREAAADQGETPAVNSPIMSSKVPLYNFTEEDMEEFAKGPKMESPNSILEEPAEQEATPQQSERSATPLLSPSNIPAYSISEEDLEAYKTELGIESPNAVLEEPVEQGESPKQNAFGFTPIPMYAFGDKDDAKDYLESTKAFSVSPEQPQGDESNKKTDESKEDDTFKSKISSFMDSFDEEFGGVSDALGEAAGGISILTKVLEAIRGALSTITDIVSKGIDQSIANQKSYMGPITARLQSFSSDSAKAYKDMSFEIRNVFTNSRYINQQKMLENLNALVEAGIGYNLEDRAYLMTIADRTVKTFDILNPALTRMERLQQADLSRPQMGLEAYLTKGLNSAFQDTSYLNSMYDTVTSALLEATSQMSFEETTGYLYNVQKWLGSLYSVGMSETAIQTIAQGLNYLGSGNVSQLTGNDQLNTLFAMSAQKAGLSYAQLLTTGVSEDNVDKLLRSMIEYLQSIAENTSSEVLRNEYGRVFGGLSVSDIRAIQNLTSQDIAYIDAYKLNYEEAFGEVTKQIEALDERTSVAEQVENMFNNLVYSIGAQVAENEKTYMTWVYANIAEQIGDLFGDGSLFGNLITAGVGAVAEVAKVSDIIAAIQGGGDSSRALRMFDDYKFNIEVDEQIDKATDDYEKYMDENTGGLWEFLMGPAILENYSANARREQAKQINAVLEGVRNWEAYSQAGVSDPLAFSKWQQGTSRIGNYSSSIAIAENAFAESESRIKAASEEVTGVDDTLSKSLDTIYDSLFGVEARPIKVMVVDIDGNLLGSTQTNEYSSNFEVEQNGAAILSQMGIVNAIE